MYAADLIFYQYLTLLQLVNGQKVLKYLKMYQIGLMLLLLLMIVAVVEHLMAGYDWYLRQMTVQVHFVAIVCSVAAVNNVKG